MQLSQKLTRQNDRGRPPPRVSWRLLLRTDSAGLTLIALFLGTIAVLSITAFLVTYSKSEHADIPASPRYGHSL